MSASRERKQRQGGTPTDKALIAKQQADQTRRKTIQYTVIGVVVAVLVAALLIWNSGIFQARATAVKVGGTNYSTAQTSYFYHSSQAYQTMMYYGSYLGYDNSKSPSEQAYGEDSTYHDYFMEAAQNEMSTVTALYDASLADADSGVTAADVKDEVNEAVESFKQAATQNGVSYKQYLRAVYGSYMSPSAFEDCLTRSLIANRYQEKHQESLDYTADELQSYYDGHADELDTFRYSYLLFIPASVETTDAEGNEIEMSDDERTAKEEENQAEAKQRAENAQAALEEGESLDEVGSTANPDSFSRDQETQGSSLNSIYSEWLADGARKDGDVTLVEDSNHNFYVVVYHDRFSEEAPTVDTRHILIRAEMDENAASPTEEQMADAKAKAEDLLAQWKNGDATEESFAELANANSDDGGSNTNGGLYEKVYEGQFVANYDAWLFDAARQPGDTEIVENQGNYYGYHVVYYVKQNPDFLTWMAKAEAAKASEDASAWLEDLQANYTAEATGAAQYLGK